MNKSATVRIDQNKASSTARERQSFNHMSFSKNLFEQYRVSEDGLSEVENKFTLKEVKNRIRISLLDFITTHLKANIFDGLQLLDDSPNIHKLFQNAFFVFKNILEKNSKSHQKELSMTIKAKESAKIRLTREDERKKTKTGKLLEELEELYNQNKKQLFVLKQQNCGLEKKILGLIEQFRMRKSFYVAQIKKLTQIINSSPYDIKKMVLTKTKEAKNLQERQQRQQKQKIDKLSLLHFEQNPTERINAEVSFKKATTLAGMVATDKKVESHSICVDQSSQYRPLKNITSIQQIDQSSLLKAK